MVWKQIDNKSENLLNITSIICFYLFVILVLQGSLKVYLPQNSTWLFSLILLVTALVFYLLGTSVTVKSAFVGLIVCLRENIAFLIGYSMFLGGIALAGLLNNGFGILAIFKYGVIFFCLSILLMIGNINSGSFQNAMFLTAVISLLAVMIAIFLGYKELLIVLGDGRIGWLYNWPGNLWKLGALIWPYFAWNILNGKSKWNYFAGIVAISLMAIDGSRTALIWSIFVWFGLLTIGKVKHKFTWKWKTSLAMALIFAFVYLILQPLLLFFATKDLGTLFVQELVNPLNQSSVSELSTSTSLTRFSTGDNISRIELIKFGLEQVQNTFPFGGGFGSSKTSTTPVIHLSYLQLLSETGIISLIGYLIMIFHPLFSGIKFVFSKNGEFNFKLEQMLTPLFAILFFGFVGLFHPVSNELTEWGIMIISISLVMRNVKKTS